MDCPTPKFCFYAPETRLAARWRKAISDMWREIEFEALSAGIEPKGLNPLAIEAMNEIGIDISHQKSKDVVSFLGQYIPYIVTVCDNARERCPIFPRSFKFLHWSFDDPAAAVGSHDEKLAVFRRVRDEIASRIDKELVSPSRGTLRDMIGPNRYRAMSLCLLATVFLVACTARQQFWASPTVREIEEVKSRTVPSNGSLLRESGPVRDTSSIRASWEIQTRSDNQMYFQWLKNQLGREYHVTSETASAMTLVKQIEGDSYTIAIKGSETPTGTVLEAQFVAAPD